MGIWLSFPAVCRVVGNDCNKAQCETLQMGGCCRLWKSAGSSPCSACFLTDSVTQYWRALGRCSVRQVAAQHLPCAASGGPTCFCQLLIVPWSPFGDKLLYRWILYTSGESAVVLSWLFSSESDLSLHTEARVNAGRLFSPCIKYPSPYSYSVFSC